MARERKTNLEMAALGLQLVKAKVAAAVQTSYLNLQRARRISEQARQRTSNYQTMPASYQNEGAADGGAGRARVEAEMYAAELEYRLALAHLKQLTGK